MIQSWFDFEVIDYLFKAFNIISIDAFVSNELDIPFVLNTKNLLKVNLKIETTGTISWNNEDSRILLLYRLHYSLYISLGGFNYQIMNN